MQKNLEFTIEEFDTGVQQLIDTTEAVNNAKELTNTYLEKTKKGETHPSCRDCSQERAAAKKAVFKAFYHLREYEREQNKFTVLLNGRFESLIDDYNNALNHTELKSETTKKALTINTNNIYKK